MMDLIPDAIRLCSLYLHVLLGALAIGLVLRTDWALFQGDLSCVDLASVSHKIVLLLLGMWVTGLIIIYIDTAFQWAKIVSNPKLMIKLVCVSVLTMNGALLHFKSFPILQDHSPLSRLDTVFLSITGCVSTGHWMLAVLIGIADLIKRFAYETILTAYIGFVGLLIFNAFCIMKLLSTKIAILRKNSLPAVRKKVDRSVVKYYRFRVAPGLESFAQVRRNTKKLRQKKLDGA